MSSQFRGQFQGGLSQCCLYRLICFYVYCTCTWMLTPNSSLNDRIDWTRRLPACLPHVAAAVTGGAQLNPTRLCYKLAFVSEGPNDNAQEMKDVVSGPRGSEGPYVRAACSATSVHWSSATRLWATDMEGLTGGIERERQIHRQETESKQPRA